MKLKEKLANVWKTITEAYSAVAVGFITVILGIGLSFIRPRKNVSDDIEPENRIRTDTEELRGATDRLSENNNRLRKLLEGLEEEETEE